MAANKKITDIFPSRLSGLDSTNLDIPMDLKINKGNPEFSKNINVSFLDQHNSGRANSS